VRAVSECVRDRICHCSGRDLVSLNREMQSKPCGQQFCLDFFRSPGRYKAGGISLADFIGGLKQAELLQIITEAIGKSLSLETAPELYGLINGWDDKSLEEKKTLVVSLLAENGEVRNFCDEGKYDEARLRIAKKWMTSSFPQADAMGVDEIQKFHSQVTMGLGVYVAPFYIFDVLKQALLSVDSSFVSPKDFVVDIHFDQGKWHYIVTGPIQLRMPSDFIVISNTCCDFTITPSGFELEKAEYDNPAIVDLLENPTPKNQNKFLANFLQRANMSDNGRVSLLAALMVLNDQCNPHPQVLPENIQQLYETFLEVVNLRALYQTFLYELDKDTIKVFRNTAVKNYLNSDNPSDIATHLFRLIREIKGGLADSDVVKAFNKACYQQYRPLSQRVEQTRELASMLKVKDVVRYLVKNTQQDTVSVLFLPTPEALTDAVVAELKKLAPQSPSSPRSFFKKSPEKEAAEKLVARVLPTLHEGKVNDEDKPIVNCVFYQMKKSEVSKILPFLTLDDRTKLLFELVTIRDRLGVVDPDFLMPSADTFEEFIRRLDTLYDSVAFELAGQHSVKDLVASMDAQVGLSGHSKMICLSQTLLNQPGSPIKAALKKVSPSTGAETPSVVDKP